MARGAEDDLYSVRSREGLSSSKERTMQERRRERRRNRRLGRSYNPDPQVLSSQVWYHGSPTKDLKKEDITIVNNEDLTPIPGFYLASLLPAADAYRDPRDEELGESGKEGSYLAFEDGEMVLKEAKKKPRGGSLYRLRIEVKSPLEREAPADPRLAALLLEVFTRVDSSLYQKEAVKQLIRSAEERSNDALMSYMVNGLRKVIKDDPDPDKRRKAEEELESLPGTLLRAGWDSAVRRMRSALSGQERSALNTSEELVLFDPKNQIKDIREG